MVWDATYNPGTTELEAVTLRKRIADLEAENAELKAAAGRAAVLLNDATYHDGRYDQHTSPEWQKGACEVADILERLAPQSPQQEEG